MARDRASLWSEISAFMFGSYRWASERGSSSLRPKALDLCMDVLEYQRQNNPAYGRYCVQSGCTHRGVRLFDYPPLPVACFRREEVVGFCLLERVAEFHSSGTTEGVSSRHVFRDLGLMQRSILYHYSLMVAGGVQPGTRYLSLMPRYEDNPHSSLGYMISQLIEALGGEKSGYYFSMSDGLDVAGLREAILDAARDDVPVHLFGPAYSYVALLDGLGLERLTCASGSCLMETGGYKGRGREVPRAELRDALSVGLGIDRGRIYGEYGMCELSSQGYEICALNTSANIPEEGLFVLPPWLMCVIYSPETMAPVLPDHDGQIALFDLCNLDSVSFILTGDVGCLVTLPASLQASLPGAPAYALRLYGRASSAIPKGCSLAWEAWDRRM